MVRLLSKEEAAKVFPPLWEVIFGQKAAPKPVKSTPKPGETPKTPKPPEGPDKVSDKKQAGD